MIQVGDQLLCNCGCDEIIIFTKRHENLKKYPRFKVGHRMPWNNNFKLSPRNNSMENNPRWKGGKGKDVNGYVTIRMPEHPKAQKPNGIILEHRLVMEKSLGRYLESWEQVHHKNGIKDDNRIENLEIVNRKNHFGEVRCPHCLKNFKIK